jgi:hypothetical protein
MPSRPASSIVQAVLANLRMAESLAYGKAQSLDLDWNKAQCLLYESDAYRQAIALIRTEFAEYLEATP